MLCLRGVTRSTITRRNLTRTCKGMQPSSLFLSEFPSSSPLSSSSSPLPSTSPLLSTSPLFSISPLCGVRLLSTSPFSGVRLLSTSLSPCHHELTKEHLYDSEGNELPLLRFLRIMEEKSQGVRYLESPEADYLVDRVGGEFDVSEVECTDVLVIPYPMRTVVNQVYGDYNKLVEDLHDYFRSSTDYPPSYIHIDAPGCRLEIPGQFRDSVKEFLEGRGF